MRIITLNVNGIRSAERGFGAPEFDDEGRYLRADFRDLAVISVYQIATPGIAATAHSAAIYKNRRFSDHAPLIIDYDFALQ